MLPTVLRRWPWCYSYSVLLCGFCCRAVHVESYRALCFSLCVCVCRCVCVCVCVFQSCLALRSPRLGKRGVVLCCCVKTKFVLLLFSFSSFILELLSMAPGVFCDISLSTVCGYMFWLPLDGSWGLQPFVVTLHCDYVIVATFLVRLY